MSSLKAIQVQCLEDSESWFPATAHDLPFLALCMVGETGEFANELKKLVRSNQHYLGDYDARLRLCEELTDVFIYMMNIAELLQMDMEWHYTQKREFNRKRFDANYKPIPVKDNPQA